MKSNLQRPEPNLQHNFANSQPFPGFMLQQHVFLQHNSAVLQLPSGGELQITRGERLASPNLQQILRNWRLASRVLLQKSGGIAANWRVLAASLLASGRMPREGTVVTVLCDMGL